MADKTALLEKRKAQKAKKPHFLRKDWYKKKRLAQTWRKPKGIHNKLRHSIANHGSMPRTGYGGPAEARHLHKSGLMPVLLYNIEGLSSIDPETHGAVIASGVGQRKKIEIMKKAEELSVRILNFKDTKKFISSASQKLSVKKDERESAKKKRDEKVVEVEKKASEPEEKTETQEEHKEAERKQAEKIITKRE